jgi:hypothetical protein
MGILLPAIGKARHTAKATVDLSNIRSLQLASLSYSMEHHGALIDVGLAHGGSLSNEAVAWLGTLQEHYDTPLALRSPGDESPHWPMDQDGQGVPDPGSVGALRRTSYGVNNYLTTFAPLAPCDKFEKVARPTLMVQFLLMAETGEYAASDHPHVESWYSRRNPLATPERAASQVEIAAWGGPLKSWDSVSNWGFLDGHASRESFRDVFESLDKNLFDPSLQER